MKLEGVDISSIQGEPDFRAVVAAGISFVWHRATVGEHQTDGKFAINRPRARAAGLAFGAYHFFAPNEDALAQADRFSAVIGSLDDSELAPAIDLEVLHGVPAQLAVQRACKFVERVEANLGRRCIVYTMPSFWPAGLDAGLLAERPLWIAHYRIDPASGRQYALNAPTVPAPWKRWHVWQSSGNRGPRVPGIACDVDRDEADSHNLADLLGPRHDTLPAPPPANDDEPITSPGTPVAVRRSSQSIRAVNAPIIDADDGRAVTPLRAGEGEHDTDPPPEAA